MPDIYRVITRRLLKLILLCVSWCACHIIFCTNISPKADGSTRSKPSKKSTRIQQINGNKKNTWNGPQWIWWYKQYMHGPAWISVQYFFHIHTQYTQDLFVWIQVITGENHGFLHHPVNQHEPSVPKVRLWTTLLAFDDFYGQKMVIVHVFHRNVGLLEAKYI